LYGQVKLKVAERGLLFVSIPTIIKYINYTIYTCNMYNIKIMKS